MKKYLAYKTIKDKNNSPLATFFNECFKETLHLRILSSPDVVTYNRFIGKEDNVHTAMLFYKTCLFDEYVNAVIQRLYSWKTTIATYNEEFNSSWHYFSLSNLRSTIKEYGGEDEDFNADGSVRTDFTHKELETYSIVKELACNDFSDTFLTTIPTHLETIYIALLNKGAMDIFKFFEDQGTPLDSYKKDANGNMVKNTWADKQLHDAKEQHICDNLANILFSVVTAINNLIVEVGNLTYNQDNKAYFKELPNKIDAILNLRITIKNTPYGNTDK